MGDFWNIMLDTSTIIGLILALFIGVTLGLIGSGGSILTVPILVYVVGLNPVIATAYSLFIVGSTAFVGSIRHTLDKNVVFKIVALFGIPSLLSVFFTRSQLVPLLPDEFVLKNNFAIPKSTFIMILFGVVMFAAASRMIKKPRQKSIGKPEVATAAIPLMFQGILIGVVSGIVGAGGGFLIVPALLFFADLPMRKAVGTSLTIVAIQSLSGFLGDLSYQHIDWPLILSFSAISIFGLFIGIRLSKRIIDGNLRKIFGWFILVMSLYILSKEILGY
ncbi:MAG TPA: sulfite exporter TauE/SafE family protein [Flavobacterium sp.]|nr:sulfite exporter TauE/SafE family protein [Flavobacterium sp.]